MKAIKSFIQQDVLLPRVTRSEVLVVYDPEERYRELCLELAGEKLLVIDAGLGSIQARETALQALMDMDEAGATTKGLLIHVPAKPPMSDEDKQRDPFSVYSAAGEIFPQSDGDSFQSLCMRAKADHVADIRRIFANDPNPEFEVIDAVGLGMNWPNLRAILEVESARDILFALLAPDKKQIGSLKNRDSWNPEIAGLLQSSLGMDLKTRSKSWETIAEEMWRFLLFSEFVFDLPAPLPSSLENVPHAADEARPLVLDLCERLRNDLRTRETYIQRANAVERDLNLADTCADLTDLGALDTFAFEEKTIFIQCMEAMQRDNLDRARSILKVRSHSIWAGQGESRSKWFFLENAVNLLEACADAQASLSDHVRTQEALLDAYTCSLREVDRHHRQMEESAAELFEMVDQLKPALRHAQKAYARVAGALQGHFLRHLEQNGWPPRNALANADVFDRFVAPRLRQSGQKTAMLLIDALRYELGVALEMQLAGEGQVKLHTSCAQLPTITLVGMASLLPEAGRDLRLIQKDQTTMLPALGETILSSVAQRMDILRKRYGQRFAETTLNEFGSGRYTVEPGVELLVLRSASIDSALENSVSMGLRMLQDVLKTIRVCVHKLKTLGFQEVIIATDHGFFLNTNAQAGDVCAKPQGKWLNIHERCLLGDGASDSANFVLPAEHLGIRGDFTQIAGPKSMATYAKSVTYFHGGASLQEAVVPLLTIRLKDDQEKTWTRPEVTLTYKRGAKRITTRLPVIDVHIGRGDLLSSGKTTEFLLEAHDKKGNVVGEARPGGHVHPSTRTITLSSSQAVSVVMRMDMDFEGKFTIKALDPTTLAVFGKLELETDYTV
ncbi:PglZ domain-containing protein [Desulfonatronum parangueonense]